MALTAERPFALPISRPRQTCKASSEFASQKEADGRPVATAAGSHQCKESDEGVVFIADELGHSRSPQLPAVRLQELLHDEAEEVMSMVMHVLG